MSIRWVQLFDATEDALFVCRRCGISRPTVRKWVRRYMASGLAGLVNRSRRPIDLRVRKWVRVRSSSFSGYVVSGECQEFRV